MALIHNGYRIQNGEFIPGTWLPAFIHNGGYAAVDIEIYRDGMIDCWGLVSFEEFKALVRRNWVVTQIPDGAVVSYRTGMYFLDVKMTSEIEPEEFIKEVEDIIRDLNGQPTTAAICGDALRTYRAQPSEDAMERLRAAYEAVPRHKRVFLGGHNKLDNEFRAILGLELWPNHLV